MRLSNLFFLLFLFVINSETSSAQSKGGNQYAAIDKRALEIPESQTNATQAIADYVMANFHTDSDKARAIFIWTASNIQYDIDNMFAINFYEKKEEKINKALKTHKGICENYAAIFNDICQKCHIKSFVVVGYTKQNGFTDYIPHAWCAALINDSWYLFDPTWGSGYVNNAYYRVPPFRLIETHMPFDPMWEFLNYPVTNQEFYENNTKQNKSKQYFSYTDTLAAYERLDNIAQSEAAVRRIEGNGVKNAMVYDRLAHLKRDIEIYNNEKEVAAHNEKIEAYNGSVADFNEGVNSFNAFIQYRNNQFKPMRPDAEIQQMFDSAYNKISSAKTKVSRIKQPDGSLASMMIPFIKSIDDAMTHVEEQKEWLQKYFSKGKFGRAGMFTKYTWMGIPLN